MPLLCYAFLHPATVQGRASSAHPDTMGAGAIHYLSVIKAAGEAILGFAAIALII